MNRRRHPTRQWDSPQVSMGAVGAEVYQQFATHERSLDSSLAAEIYVLAFAGQVALEEPNVPVTGQGIAARLLARYQQFGLEALFELQGRFLMAVWDGRERRLALINDRYGLQPAYYWVGGPGLVFATELKSIAAHPRFQKRVDQHAVFDLLAAEQMLGECTLYEGVQALPPASLLVYQDGRASLRAYWQPRFYQPGDPVPSEKDAVEGLSSQVCQAVEHDLASIGSERINLLLTGGLDSRLLAGALARCAGEGRVLSSTLGHEQARDVRFGREVARAAGFPYARVPADPAYVAHFSEEWLYRTEGNMSVHAAWILGQRAFLQQNDLNVVMTGVGGETISGRTWISALAEEKPHNALARMADGYWRFHAAARLLRPHTAAELEHSNRALLQRIMASAPSQAPDVRYDYLTYRLFYRRPTGNVLSEDARVLEPLLRAQLMDYALRLPPKMRRGGTLYRKMILTCFPVVAQAGYSDTNRPLSDTGLGAVVGRYARQLRRRAARRGRAHLPFLRARFGSDDTGSTIHYNTWLRGPSRLYIQQLLAETSDLLDPWLDVHRVKALAEDHLSGRRDEYHLLSSVITLALWLKQYG